VLVGERRRVFLAWYPVLQTKTCVEKTLRCYRPTWGMTHRAYGNAIRGLRGQLPPTPLSAHVPIRVYPLCGASIAGPATPRLLGTEVVAFGLTHRPFKAFDNSLLIFPTPSPFLFPLPSLSFLLPSLSFLLPSLSFLLPSLSFLLFSPLSPS